MFDLRTTFEELWRKSVWMSSPFNTENRLGLLDMACSLPWKVN